MNGIKVGTVIDNGVDFSTPAPPAPPTKKGAKPKPTPTPAKKNRAKTVTSFFDEYKEALEKNGAQPQEHEGSWITQTWRGNGKPA